MATIIMAVLMAFSTQAADVQIVEGIAAGYGIPAQGIAGYGMRTAMTR